jgi:hypothetical protein
MLRLRLNPMIRCRQARGKKPATIRPSYKAFSYLSAMFKVGDARWSHGQYG